ncbi:MAG: DUF2721 domain-containing protein [Gemmatimonadaceae bacterium]|nr:DUF2721 domain-containing protein [Gemmatimonadaceae bacterium]
MQTDVQIESIAHVIELAIAPVFMLTGIAALLGVLTNRLARIIDRARLLEGGLPDLTGEHKSVASGDLIWLSRRARHINRAISLCTMAALLVCLVIAVLFVSALMSFNAAQFIAALFICTMVCLIAGLVSFLREISHATRSLRIGPH